MGTPKARLQATFNTDSEGGRLCNLALGRETLGLRPVISPASLWIPSDRSSSTSRIEPSHPPNTLLLDSSCTPLPSSACPARLSHSYPSAMEYQSQASQPVVAVVARCLSYISGSLVAVLLLFTLIDESILLYVKYQDRNLLW